MTTEKHPRRSKNSKFGDVFGDPFGDVKQNSPEAMPLGCEHLVGVRRFELLTSSVSGKRSPPELNAQMERTTGLEPATPTLARLCSTN